MTTRVLSLALATLLVGAIAQGQVRITSLNSNGTLVWTNSVARGVYGVEGANSPTGPWTSLTSVIDFDSARTNPITAQIPLTNSQEYFRVGWTVPDPIGVWDYQARDNQGTLVVTGQLAITSKTLLYTNDPNNLAYTVQGNYNLQYAGPPTNQTWYLGPHIGNGDLSGFFYDGSAVLRLRWPQNTADYNMDLSRDIWANTYTGQWVYIGQAPMAAGTFTATKK
jgi:hypothetical protein